jgi:hypothetical protein
MTFQWLGQGQVMQLQAGHIYRGRWLIPPRPGDFPCPAPAATIDTIQSMLKGLGGGQWQDPIVSQNTNVFDLLSQYGPWPADRRIPGPELNPNRACVVWTQQVPTAPVNLETNDIRGALNFIGGQLLDFWDETSDQRLIQTGANYMSVNPSTPPIGPSTPPFVPPPIINIIPPGGGTVSPGQPPIINVVPKEKKKMSPIMWVLGGAVLIGAIYFVTQSE